MDLRNLLKDKVQSQSLHLLLPKTFSTNNKIFPKNNLIHHLPNDACTLANYYQLFRWCELAAYAKFKVDRFNSIPAIHKHDSINEKSTQWEDIPLVADLCCKDISRVNLFIACSAWLTTDSFRWHQLNPLIPEDLGYGLIYDYPDYIMPFCCVAGDIKRNEYISQLDSSKLDLAKSQAIDDVINAKPNCNGIKELLNQQLLT